MPSPGNGPALLAIPTLATALPITCFTRWSPQEGCTDPVQCLPSQDICLAIPYEDPSGAEADGGNQTGTAAPGLCADLYGCPDARRGDGRCDAACHNAVCGYDGGDCPVPATEPPRKHYLLGCGSSGWGFADQCKLLAAPLVQLQYQYQYQATSTSSSSSSSATATAPESGEASASTCTASEGGQVCCSSSWSTSTSTSSSSSFSSSSPSYTPWAYSTPTSTTSTSGTRPRLDCYTSTSTSTSISISVRYIAYRTACYSCTGDLCNGPPPAPTHLPPITEEPHQWPEPGSAGPYWLIAVGIFVCGLCCMACCAAVWCLCACIFSRRPDRRPARQTQMGPHPFCVVEALPVDGDQHGNAKPRTPEMGICLAYDPGAHYPAPASPHLRPGDAEGDALSLQTPPPAGETGCSSQRQLGHGPALAPATLQPPQPEPGPTALLQQQHQGMPLDVMHFKDASPSEGSGPSATRPSLASVLVSRILDGRRPSNRLDPFSPDYAESRAPHLMDRHPAEAHAPAEAVSRPF